MSLSHEQQQINGLFYTIATGNSSGVTGLSVANLTANTLNIANGGLKLPGGTLGQVLTTYANGQTYWSTPSGGGGGGVTQVATGGSGLGFSLSGGPITTTGTVTLNAPTSATLRTNLNIGSVANINLNGTTTQYLRGDGVWSTVSGGSGTVSNVGGTGSGLGFSLSGAVTTTGNLTLAVPSSATLITNLGLGNIATINATGSTTNYLRADGTWQPVSGGGTTLPNQSGNTGKFLTTDGTNLSWGGMAGSGTVTSVGSNGGGLGFSLTGTVTSTGNITLVAPTTVGLRTSLAIGNVANINFNGNGSQALLGNGVWGSIGGGGSTSNVPNLTGNTSQWLRGDGWSTLGNIATVNIDGNSSNVLYGNGVFAVLPVAPTITGGNNITVSSGVVSLDTLKFAKEAVQLITIPSTGTLNVDVLTNSVVYNTAVATSPITLNFRGNGSVTMNNLLSVGQSITATVLITNGPTPQAVSQVTIDGGSQAVKMITGTNLSGVANAVVAYTFTAFKTATSTYTVIGSKASYA